MTPEVFRGTGDGSQLGNSHNHGSSLLVHRTTSVDGCSLDGYRGPSLPTVTSRSGCKVTVLPGGNVRCRFDTIRVHGRRRF